MPKIETYADAKRALDEAVARWIDNPELDKPAIIEEEMHRENRHRRGVFANAILNGKCDPDTMGKWLAITLRLERRAKAAGPQGELGL